MVPRRGPQTTTRKDSPRIRGDGPAAALSSRTLARFSPYSRGWSDITKTAGRLHHILPVFAGMVHAPEWSFDLPENSPRIRGDGPPECLCAPDPHVFSPYSRGWSLVVQVRGHPTIILPVFAGMVPTRLHQLQCRTDSPRIRGDGPGPGGIVKLSSGFSPYSRGWSLSIRVCGCRPGILPVFAGMVRVIMRSRCWISNSPRIRGDGPNVDCLTDHPRLFSPYSRGWSVDTAAEQIAVEILPVFAGMVPITRSQSWNAIPFSPYSRGWSPTATDVLNAQLILPVFAGMVPTAADWISCHAPFSPYSRGWSRTASDVIQSINILPVFAGMVPHRRES